MKHLPLHGIRVADLTMVWAGPYATKLLAEMGAEVIKVESPFAWDLVRTLIPMPGVPEFWNASFYFNDYNRDKKSVTLHLADPRGRELFLRLVERCDVVVENFRADVLEKLGLGYEVLRQRKPDIILVSMAGFGKTGPERDYVGYGPIIEQMAGLVSLTGYGDDGVPYKTGISYGDPVAGAAAAGAVALALLRRQRTGKGAFIDLAQREVVSTLIGEAFVRASLRGVVPPHRGNRDERFAPQGVYRCFGEDRWVALSVRNDAEWRTLASIIGRPELAALTLEARRARHDEIDRAIEAWTSTIRPAVAAQVLQGNGIPAAPVIDTEAIHDDPNLVAREFWVTLPHPRMKPWRQPRSPWRLREANPVPRRHAPLFGEHNEEVLGGLLGLTPAELEELEAAGVIGRQPRNARAGG